MHDSHEASDVVQLLSEDGVAAGTMDKQAAHTSPGHLHRAYSVFLFDETGRVLLQRRAASKYHFSGKWSNTCCSHPSQTLGVLATARRRLLQELGVEVALEAIGSFRYTAIDDVSGLVEREDDTVLVGYIRSDATLTPNPGEVGATRFVALPALEDELRKSPGRFTPWLAPALGCVIRAGHPQAANIG
jgi:isopentenyl-diphosphate delta-isomerase